MPASRPADLPPPTRREALVWAVAGGAVAAAGEAVVLAAGPLAPGLVDVLLAWAVDLVVTLPVAVLVGLALPLRRRGVLVAALCGAAVLGGLQGDVAWAIGLAVLALAAARVPVVAVVAIGVAAGTTALPRLVGARTPGPVTLVVTVDGLRADAWAALRHTSELAVQGRRLLGVAPSSRTDAALDAVLVGHMPWAVGGVPLAERARRDGCATGAFVSAPVGHRAGFATYDDALAGLPLLPRSGAGRLLGIREPAERPAWETSAVAARWLGRQTGCAFAWVHLADPLAPLAPPPPWDARFYEGKDPGAPTHPGLPLALSAAFPGVRDPDYVWAAYWGEVGVADEAVGRLVAAAGPDARVAVVGLGGLAMGPETYLAKAFEPQTLEVPVALRGEAPSLHHVVSLADVYAWLAGEEPDARPWAVDGDSWAVRAAESWRVSDRGRVQEHFPVADPKDQARRRLLLDVEEERLREARRR